MSARSQKALQGNISGLANHLERNEERSRDPLEDIAFTLHAGRKAFPYRAAFVCASSAEGAALMRSDPLKLEKAPSAAPRVAFLFPGQGSQYPHMGANLYRSHSLFRTLFDHCAELLQPHLGAHLRDLIFAEGQSVEDAAEVLRRTEVTQPALFTIEYCLAELWKQWGVDPFATIGHSVGEFVSAVLAGVFSLEEALYLVAHRGRLMGSQSPGSMLSVRLGAAVVEPRLGGGLCIASDNSPSLCVVAGPSDEIAAFETLLTSEGVACRPLVTSHAFHSSMMDPVTEPFLELVRGIKLNAPKKRFISTATGTWITPEQATDPQYWARHMRQPVRFSSGIQTLLREEGALVFIEVGPRLVLSTLVGQQQFDRNRATCVASLGNDDEKSLATMLGAAGKLFTQGVTLDPGGLHGPELRQRVSLPTYAFDRKRYWLDAKQLGEMVLDQNQGEGVPSHGRQTESIADVRSPEGRRSGHPIVGEQLRVMQRQLDVLLSRKVSRS